MTRHTLKLALAALFLSCAIALPAPHQAQAQNWIDQAGRGGLDDIGKEGYGQLGSPAKPLKQMVVMIIRIFLGFLGIIFLVMLILAGFKYMTAAGNEEKVKEAVKQIRNAIIGLLIILTSFAITSFISNVVVTKITAKQ